jgi:hypothetical protein
MYKIELFLTMRKHYDLVRGKETLHTNKNILKNGITEIRKVVYILKFVWGRN